LAQAGVCPVIVIFTVAVQYMACLNKLRSFPDGEKERLSLPLSSLTTASDLTGCESFSLLVLTNSSEECSGKRKSATLRLLEVEGVESDLDEPRSSQDSNGSCTFLSPQCGTISYINAQSCDLSCRTNQSERGTKSSGHWDERSCDRVDPGPVLPTEVPNDVAQRTLQKMQGFMNRVREPCAQKPPWVLRSAFEEGVSADW